MTKTRARPARLRPATRRQRLAAEQAVFPAAPEHLDDDAGAGRSSADSGEMIGRLGTPSHQALALALLVAVSYLPALEAGFVWDDVIFVEEAVDQDWSRLWNI